METLLYIIMGLQVGLGAYITWAWGKIDRSLFELEARAIANTVILSSINNMLYVEMFGEEDEANSDLVESPLKVH